MFEELKADARREAAFLVAKIRAAKLKIIENDDPSKTDAPKGPAKNDIVISACVHDLAKIQTALSPAQVERIATMLIKLVEINETNHQTAPIDPNRPSNQVLHRTAITQAQYRPILEAKREAHFKAASKLLAAFSASRKIMTEDEIEKTAGRIQAQFVLSGNADDADRVVKIRSIAKAIQKASFVAEGLKILESCKGCLNGAFVRDLERGVENGFRSDPAFFPGQTVKGIRQLAEEAKTSLFAGHYGPTRPFTERQMKALRALKCDKYA
jgi:hypothetical protein